jgi:hypothetical protein
MSRAPSRAAETGGLAAILFLAAVLNFTHADFPFELHPDEATKVGFIQTGTQDFKHPLLLLQLVRGMRRLAPTDDPQRIAEMGRTVSAVAGLAILAFAHALFRRSLGARWALFGTLVLAVAPVLVVHAHYFKEDVLLTAACLGALVALCRCVEARPTATIELGVALALACSSHYKGALVVAFGLVAPALVAVGSWRRWYRRMSAAIGIAALVFAIVDLPMLYDPATALAGARFEAWHAASGHHVTVGGPAEGAAFHLRKSVVPGLTGFVAALAAVGAVVGLRAWQATVPATRLLVGFGAVAYLVVELAPLKPFPGYMRYVLPAVPAMVLAACLGLREIAARLRARSLGWVAMLVAVAAVAVPAARSVRLVRHLNDDSRASADAWLAAHDGYARRELYAGRPVDLVSVADVDLAAARAAGVTHLVASSFLYERIARGAALAPGTAGLVHEYAEKYRRLFTRPYVEIPPRYMSFAFSDPTIRIVDIREEGVPAVSR